MFQRIRRCYFVRKLWYLFFFFGVYFLQQKRAINLPYMYLYQQKLIFCVKYNTLNVLETGQILLKRITIR